MKFAFQNGTVHYCTLNTSEITAKRVKKFPNDFYIILQFFPKWFFLEIFPIFSVKSSFSSLIMCKDYVLNNNFAHLMAIFSHNETFGFKPLMEKLTKHVPCNHFKLLLNYSKLIPQLICRGPWLFIRTY